MRLARRAGVSGYDRDKALAYARAWALGRNPAYLDFHGLGGDCTNFVSQCLYAGGGVMNVEKGLNWFYFSARNRTASWTGVEYLYTFLVNNKRTGPYAREAEPGEMEIGDVVQLALIGRRFSHAALVVALEGGEIYVAAHSADAWMRPLATYAQPRRRFLHIESVRSK